MSRLVQIQQTAQNRAAAIVSAHPDWPCRKGCADCCRNLAAEPQISEAEWRLIEPALTPDLRHRIQNTESRTCPLLDLEANACQIYQVRPVACRAYGFYAERDQVLGCHRIEAIAAQDQTVIWGNHPALLEDLTYLGPKKPLSRWLNGGISK